MQWPCKWMCVYLVGYTYVYIYIYIYECERKVDKIEAGGEKSMQRNRRRWPTLLEATQFESRQLDFARRSVRPGPTLEDRAKVKQLAR